MKVHSIEFLGSFTQNNQCPPPNLPEYAFIGRSNVGKSSLINAITGRKSLARVSKTPGKTQTLNFFLVNDNWRLVDLPGYGYAKVSQKQREKWDLMIMNFLAHRPNLVTAFVLVDARIAPQQSDLDFMNRLGKKNIPFAIIFTKWDKLKPQARTKVLPTYKKAMSEYWEEMPHAIFTSSINKEGIEEVQNYIQSLNESLL